MCNDSRTLLAEGLICVRMCHPGHHSWGGDRLVLVLSDMIVLGTVVTPSILHRNMIQLQIGDIILEDNEASKRLVLNHRDHSYELEFASEKDKIPWLALLEDLKGRSKVTDTKTCQEEGMIRT